MKTIGFVDYYLSEYHANNYPIWMKEICEKNGWDFEIKYAYAELDVSPVDGKTTDEWCKEYGITKCNTIEELCEKSDYILVLAPSDPDRHLDYAKIVLKYKKKTYIDKTFAPDYKTAKAIFDLADKYNTPFFSTSALRYADELNEIDNIDNLIITGGGGNFDEYIIHQIEMAVKLMKTKAVKIKTETQNKQCLCRVMFADGRSVALIYGAYLPFAVCVDKKNGEYDYKLIQSEFFKNLAKKILEFYNTGKPDYDVNETLEVMRIREALVKGKEKSNTWVEL